VVATTELARSSESLLVFEAGVLYGRGSRCLVASSIRSWIVKVAQQSMDPNGKPGQFLEEGQVVARLPRPPSFSVSMRQAPAMEFLDPDSTCNASSSLI
jgi:hypothetical protein